MNWAFNRDKDITCVTSADNITTTHSILSLPLSVLRFMIIMNCLIYRNGKHSFRRLVIAFIIGFIGPLRISIIIIITVCNFRVPVVPCDYQSKPKMDLIDFAIIGRILSIPFILLTCIHYWRNTTFRYLYRMCFMNYLVLLLFTNVWTSWSMYMKFYNAPPQYVRKYVLMKYDTYSNHNVYCLRNIYVKSMC